MDGMDVDFELSQQLQGHDNQVRCAVLLNDTTLLTGGLDSQVIVWTRADANSPFALGKKLRYHTEMVYCLAVSTERQGCFYSGSKDRTACLVNTDGDTLIQFIGHDGPVCSVAERGQQLVTGAWDGTAKVWNIENAEVLHNLDAGAHAVTVAVAPDRCIVTGSQDRSLRVFRDNAEGVPECIHTYEQVHEDIIRGIAMSSSYFWTASNDATIKMWTFNGGAIEEMATLAGHSSYVYAVARSADEQHVLSSSDDCTLKVWSLENLTCKQSIMHANTVWYATSFTNGDLVTCCADGVVRIWTVDPERMAPEAERVSHKETAETAAMQAAAKGTSSTSVSALDISEMPRTIGKKNGEIKCFKEGGTTFAFSWNAGARCWDKIGEVVGQEAPAKKFYEGDQIFPAGEYDFVFDVDMGPSLGMRKLPYNKGQNPMEVAESFCSREQIHKGNLEQIRQFIIQNAGEGGGGGSASQAAAPAAPPAAAPPPAASSSLFPVMTPVVFKDGKFDALQNKILEFNEQVDEDKRLDATEVMHLKNGIDKLKSGIMSNEIRPTERDIIRSRLGEWPTDKLFPVADLWRLYLVHPQSADFFKGSDRGAPFIAQILQLLAGDNNGPLGLCCTRFLANLFIYQTNRYAIFDKRQFVLRAVEPALSSTNKHTRVASCTVLLNMAIVLHESSNPPKPWDAETGSAVASLALGFLERAGADDADAAHRCLLTIGSLLPRDSTNGGAVKAQAVRAGVVEKAAAMEAKIGANYVAELRRLLA